VRAVSLWLAAAGQGEPKSQFNLGVAYQTGDGVSENLTEAARWYRAAALKGDVKARYNLGLLYLDGAGVPRDPAEARHWLGLAAAALPPGEKRDEALRLLKREDTP
ncbi:MAG: sel1 repeat family protein, partial [Alphaproteobacteria bacterium]|nr:sel1 repeat family protein [Alphaproteobacteria bacterium]